MQYIPNIHITLTNWCSNTKQLKQQGLWSKREFPKINFYFPIWLNWIFPGTTLLQFFLGTKVNFPGIIIILLVSIAIHLKFLSWVSIKVSMSFSSFDVLFLGWNLLITSNQKVSLNNPEYLEICCYISWFCLKGCYDLKYVFVTSWWKMAITPKWEIFHNVVASKFNLRLIENPPIRRIDVISFLYIKKHLDCPKRT